MWLALAAALGDRRCSSVRSCRTTAACGSRMASWLGVIIAARRAGISKRYLPLLAYPVVSVAIVVLAGESLLDPWGVSWLWVAAVLGPVIGARTLLNRAGRRSPAAP